MSFLNDIKDHHFTFLTETWSGKIDSIPGFTAISTCTAKPKSNSACRISGGISLLFKTKLQSMVTIERLTKNTLWCRIDKSLLNSTKHLYLCGIYIPPIKSHYFDEDIFEKLEILQFSQKGNMLLLGDFNARTSKLDDFISKEGNTFIKDITENSAHPPKRNNFDSSVNDHGKVLLQLCKNCNLRILNGTTLGDSLGKPTYHGRHGTSLLDYAICHQDLVPRIENLVIKPPSYLSDHSQILTWVKTKLPIAQEQNPPNAPTSQHKLPVQFIWENNSVYLFKQQLLSVETQSKLNQFINSPSIPSKEEVNNYTSKFQDIILNAAKKSLRIKKTNKECRLKRHSCVRKLANLKQQRPP